MPNSLFVLLAVSLCTYAQQISLEEVVLYRYYPNLISGLNSMDDGDFYTRMSDTSDAIVKCSYKTGDIVETLFSVRDTQGEKVSYFRDYIISPDGSKILVETNRNAIYRRSSTSRWYLYDRADKSLRKLSAGGDQEVPSFSHDSKKIAFVRSNNLFVLDIPSWQETQVTTDGRFNFIINGKPDWVYEEEFEYNKAYAFTADSKKLAWMRTDETNVKTFAFLYCASASAHACFRLLYSL